MEVGDVVTLSDLSWSMQLTNGQLGRYWSIGSHRYRVLEIGAPFPTDQPWYFKNKPLNDLKVCLENDPDRIIYTHTRFANVIERNQMLQVGDKVRITNWNLVIYLYKGTLQPGLGSTAFAKNCEFTILAQSGVYPSAGLTPNTLMLVAPNPDFVAFAYHCHVEKIKKPVHVVHVPAGVEEVEINCPDGKQVKVNLAS